MSGQAELNRSTLELAVLVKAAELMNSLDLDEVLSKTLTLVTDTVKAERGSFFLFNEYSPTADYYVTQPGLPPRHTGAVTKQVLKEGLAAWVHRHKQPAIVTDTEHDDRWITLPDDATTVRSALCVPFLVDEQVNGIMTLEHSSPGYFGDDDLRLVTAVANQATITLNNVRLFKQIDTHERQLRAVLQSVNVPILTISAPGNIKLLNPAALDMIGLPKGRVIGSPLDAVSDNPILAMAANKIAAGETHFELRDEIRGIDYDVHVTGWQEAESGELGRVIVFNDITSLKDLARLKTQMLQLVSHDLKNPLSTMKGYIDLMQMDVAPDHEFHTYLGDMAQVTQRMLEMVKELLNLEKIEATAEEEVTTFDPNIMLAEIVAAFEKTAQQKKQSLLQKITPGMPDLHGNEMYIREAIDNLVSNAIKYTPANGLIIVQASIDDAAQRFEFKVTDTGYGISPERQARIFERFYRAKQPGTEHISGTGLGLSLVKTVIERHGGEVWFESETGQGSTFGFWLPLPDAASQQQTPTS